MNKMEKHTVSWFLQVVDSPERLTDWLCGVRQDLLKSSEEAVRLGRHFRDDLKSQDVGDLSDLMTRSANDIANYLTHNGGQVNHNPIRKAPYWDDLFEDVCRSAGGSCSVYYWTLEVAKLKFKCLVRYVMMPLDLESVFANLIERINSAQDILEPYRKTSVEGKVKGVLEEILSSKGIPIGKKGLWS